jgi:hypothetical protein
MQVPGNIRPRGAGLLPRLLGAFFINQSPRSFPTFEAVSPAQACQDLRRFVSVC